MLMADQMLDLKVMHSKREREVALLQEKSAFLKRVNADLHTRLEAFELDGFRQQSDLQHQVRQWLAVCRVCWPGAVRKQTIVYGFSCASTWLLQLILYSSRAPSRKCLSTVVQLDRRWLPGEVWQCMCPCCCPGL
jgi:hypothetical protein